jgi:hypothetical protein
VLERNQRGEWELSCGELDPCGERRWKGEWELNQGKPDLHVKKRTLPTCEEEMEGGVEIELRGIQPTCEREIEEGGETREVIGNAFTGI